MRFSSHLEDILHDPSIDAVMIGCTTNQHADLACAAAEAGKAILLQKPMALTLEDCDRIIHTVERTGVYCSLAYQMRHDPSNIKIKNMVDIGALGKVGLLRRRHGIHLLFDSSFVSGSTRWHLNPILNKGMFMDDASHAADFIYWILGEPISVVAEIDQVLTDVAPDDIGVAIYRFESGAMAVLENSSVALAGENTTEIYGDGGVLIQNYDDLVSSRLPRLPGTVALKYYQRNAAEWVDLNIPSPDSHGERIVAVPRAFLDAYLNNKPPPVNVHEGRVSVEMVLGAYYSAQTGARVKFPLSYQV
jgi:predicted dehydrogenase